MKKFMFLTELAEVNVILSHKIGTKPDMNNYRAVVFYIIGNVFKGHSSINFLVT